MTAEVLQILDGDTTIEVFLNDQDKIYIGEVNREDPMYAFCVALSYEDWRAMRKFIDKQFSSLKS
jgi:hypothetical protein